MKKLKNKSSIRVDNACGEDWNKMAGNENVRFCEHCAKYVNEISSMTRKEAVKLIRRSSGNLCVRYYHHPTSKGPLFAENLIQISRRVPTVATGIITASFGLTSMTLAQGSLVQTPRAAAAATAEKRNTDVVVKDDAKASVRASIKGTVSDPNGVVIPGSEMVLKDANGGTIRRTVSSGEGGY